MMNKMTRGRAGNGRPHEDAPGRQNGRGPGPFVEPSGIFDYDDPVSIRARKYTTGTHVILEEIGVTTGVTPSEVVWTKNEPGSTATGPPTEPLARDDRSRCF